ncbi:MAG: carbamoyltransferase HypF [Euryarchaeota archaeon]|nr:carbamoyltransferase HypF [Euryarchaeota archaeon]
MPAVKVHVSGVVQGVGFRPFVYRIAVQHSLRGYVKNLGDAGVEIWIEGTDENIEKFIADLKNRAPPLARVEHINVEKVRETGVAKFQILPSSNGGGGGDSIVPPDVALCDDCLRELFDPTNPRYMYPFIVCTNCGPRFSIIESLPYDRENTAMREFPMCEFCDEEYKDPLNRRYHAEPVCCDSCGPHYSLIDSSGAAVPGEPLKETAKLLDSGHIVAIKGIGGFHLACDAFNSEAVRELRRRLGREAQPFAVMVRSIEEVRKLAYITEHEEKELVSYRRPIVLLRKKIELDGVAPGLHTIGVMLPYAGVHYILFHHSSANAYVMTSANYPGMPMLRDNERISEFRDIADYFLVHNRRIVNRIDDSVVRFHGSRRVVIRRSRGFVPLPISSKYAYVGIAMGAELMNSFSIIKGSKIYPGQYIGDTAKVEVMEFQREAIERMRGLLGIDDYELVIVDSHPLYNTTRAGLEMSKEVLKVQHHIAHVAGVMAERALDEMVGIAIDAVGYGSDGKIWGGEIVSIAPGSVRREWHIPYYSLPGGDLASHYPLRALVGVLSTFMPEEEIERLVRSRCAGAITALPHGETEFGVILRQTEIRRNAPQTSSLGRLLDSIAVFLNIAYRRTYEGEPAMKLESAAMGGKDIHFKLREDEFISSLFEEIMSSNASVRDIAYSAHLAIARFFAERAVRVAEERGIENVGVSGGVAYNALIVSEIEKTVNDAGLKFYSSEEVPRGDNGISVGQAYVGGMYLEGIVNKNEIK